MYNSSRVKEVARMSKDIKELNLNNIQVQDFVYNTLDKIIEENPFYLNINILNNLYDKYNAIMKKYSNQKWTQDLKVNQSFFDFI